MNSFMTYAITTILGVLLARFFGIGVALAFCAGMTYGFAIVFIWHHMDRRNS